MVPELSTTISRSICSQRPASQFDSPPSSSKNSSKQPPGQPDPPEMVVSVSVPVWVVLVEELLVLVEVVVAPVSLGPIPPGPAQANASQDRPRTGRIAMGWVLLTF